MFSIDKLVLDVVMVISTLWMVDRYWSTFFERKKINILSFVIWGMFSVCQFFFEAYSGELQIGMSLLNIFLMLLVVIFSYNSKGKGKIFLLIVFYTTGALIELLSFFLLSNILKNMELLHTMGDVVSKIIVISCVYILSIIWNKKNENLISTKHLLLLLLIPIGSSCIAIIEFYSNGNTLFSFITTSILILFNLIIFEIYTELNEVFLCEREKMIYIQQLELISKNTVEQKKMMEDFREQKHNLVNELITLKIGIENYNNMEVLNSLSKIIQNYNIERNISNSGNTTIDAIINFKYAIAKEEGIDFCLKVFVPDSISIEQSDIGVVLGNALDNAIEATKRCTNYDKLIEILITVRKEALVIIIKNPFEGEIKQDSYGNYLSTKEEAHLHGFGLNSIRRIAEYYQGEVIINSAEQKFVVTIVMNLK